MEAFLYIGRTITNNNRNWAVVHQKLKSTEAVGNDFEGASVDGRNSLVPCDDVAQSVL